MSHISVRGRALTRLAVFCLGTSALTLPALAGTYNVGGGTIITSQTDNSADNTGAGGGFLLQPNTTGANDSVAITGVAINSTTGRALDLGNTLPSSGSYSVTMQGSSMTTAAGLGVASVIESSSGGNISFDSTGGAANTISGPIGINLNANGGNVSIKTGADTITTSGATGEILYATTTGTGTIAIDTAGATLTSNGLYGISAISGGSGAITIGGLNGGIASTINVANGTGITTSSQGNQSITLASSGVINALNGFSVQGNTVAIDSFGTINASGNAIAALSGTGPDLTVTLESGSVTRGAVVGGNSTGTSTFNVMAGADISNATFNGNGSNATLNLAGSGNGSLLLSSVSNIGSFQMTGSGIWTLTGTGTDTGSFTVSSGTLRLGAGASLSSANALILNSGTFDLNGNSAAIGSLSSVGGTSTSGILAIGSGTLTINQTSSASYLGTITGTGGLVFNGPGTLQLNGRDDHTGPITVNGGSLVVMNTSGTSDLTINGGSFEAIFKTLGFGTLSGTGGTLNLSGSYMTFTSNTDSTFAGVIADQATGQFTKAGSGTLILTGASTALSNLVISQGTLQFGNGGTSGGFPAHSITDNAALVFDRSDSFVYGGVISGSGSVTETGGGQLILTGANTYTGGTLIKGGTVQLGAGGQLPSGSGLTLLNLASSHGIFDLNGQSQTIGTLSGTGDVLLNGGSLTISSAASSSYSGTIQGSGALIVDGPGNFSLGGGISVTAPITVNGGSLTITGLYPLGGGADLTLNGGTLFPGAGASFGKLSGTGGVLNMGLSFVSFTSASNSTFAGTITGNAPAQSQLTKDGTGTLTLTGNSDYTGPTVIAGGTLQIGNGGTSGFLPGNFTNNATLVFDRSDNIAFAGAISGTGSVTKMGSGSLTLSGTGTYTGATSVNAGTLNVTGSIASSSVNVASGGTLSGTGKVGATSVASGGTLTPGSGAAPGTLTIAGNLALQSGSSFADAITSTAAGLAGISGTASINGNAFANFAAGSYTSGQRYTLITASGGLSGTFASLVTTGLPGGLRGYLSYDANDAYLSLGPYALAPALGGNATTNQHNVVTAIDAAVAGGAISNGGFNALYGLSGSALNSAIDQISGRIGPNVSNAVGQSFLSFLAVTAEGGAGGPGNYAPGGAYDAVAAPHRAQLDTGETRVWGGAYGGHVGLSADAASGAAGLSASNVGLIGGADIQLDDGILAGVTLDWGRQNFSSGNGSGLSTDYAFSLYGRVDQGPAYVTAAFGYGWHQIKTLRVVTVSGTDVLQGKQNADDFGGRIEAGWRIALDDSYSIAPYGAFAGESFESPAYAETAVAGASTFALSYAAHSSTLGRSELGAHLDRGYDLVNGGLTADIKAAWAHQLDDLPFTQANFENLATTSFQVLGVRPTRDTALLGADIELKYRSGLFLGLKGEGQFGAGTTILEGMGNFGLRW